MLAGCGTTLGTVDGVRVLPTPTLANLFRKQATVPPAVTPVATTPTLPAESVATPAPTAEIELIPVYDDQLNNDWDASQSAGVQLSLNSMRFVAEGDTSIVITPTKDFGTAFFTVRKDAEQQYLRDETLGISFQLNGGPEGLRSSDLAIAVVGSNALPYWTPDDDSVHIDGRVAEDMPLFSETRLYHLGFDRDIPPETWVTVELLLDAQEFDPPYTYITGFYIKNDQGFRAPFFVDTVNLMVF